MNKHKFTEIKLTTPIKFQTNVYKAGKIEYLFTFI